jgi:cation:H+ antiporter
VSVTVFVGLAGLLCLFLGGELLVRGSSALSLRFGLSPLVIGLTVVAFGTSIPELLVSIDAALAGANDIAVGNVVGSNIANIALILGLAALLRPLMVESRVIGIDLPVMIIASILMVLALGWGYILRVEGLILASGLVFYVRLTFRKARSESPPVEETQAEIRQPAASITRLAVLIASGLVLLFGGARLLVDSAVEIASVLSVSQAVIGLTIVAVGTSLPELATTIVASLRREGDIAIGNVIGSNTFNIFGVLGLTAVVRPLESGGIGWIDLGVMFGVAFMLAMILLRRLFLSRWHGCMFLMIYAAYTSWRVL